MQRVNNWSICYDCDQQNCYLYVFSWKSAWCATSGTPCRKGPLCKFQPGGLHNLNPPLPSLQTPSLISAFGTADFTRHYLFCEKPSRVNLTRQSDFMRDMLKSHTFTHDISSTTATFSIPVCTRCGTGSELQESTPAGFCVFLSDPDLDPE